MVIEVAGQIVFIDDAAQDVELDVDVGRAGVALLLIADEQLAPIVDQLVVQRRGVEHADGEQTAERRAGEERREDAAAGRLVALIAGGWAGCGLDVEVGVGVGEDFGDVQLFALAGHQMGLLVVGELTIALEDDGAATDDDGEVAFRSDLRDQARRIIDRKLDRLARFHLDEDDTLALRQMHLITRIRGDLRKLHRTEIEFVAGHIGTGVGRQLAMRKIRGIRSHVSAL